MNETTKSAAALGIVIESAQDETRFFEVWPEHEFAICVFRRLSSQWFSDALGRPIGIRMEAMPFVLEIEEVPRDRWREVVADVQCMESAVISHIKHGGESGG